MAEKLFQLKCVNAHPYIQDHMISDYNKLSLTGVSPSTSCSVSEAKSILPLEQQMMSINPLAACAVYEIITLTQQI